uniref:Uncharacterized protein n=1 Tax=Anguilla anguilla TaxID=7936 RepID=A0A0E9W2W0_ANGAN
MKFQVKDLTSLI